MSFALLAAALAIATALAIVLPVLRHERRVAPVDRAAVGGPAGGPDRAGAADRGGVPDRAEASLAIFRDQLAEVERDAERGLISGEEARAARTEIERRMLAAARARGGGPVRSRRAPVIAAALVVPLAAGGIYALTGRPGVPSLPHAERAAALAADRDAEAEVAQLVERLRRRLEADPEGGPTEGWVLLGQTQLRRGDYDAAVRAFEVASAREDAAPGILTQHAEALIGASGGVVTPAALALVDRALARDPTIPAGHFYRALARAQSGDSEGAREMLLDRLAQASGPEPWTQAFLAEANRLGAEAGLEPISAREAIPGVAAMEDVSPEDRDAQIRAMVDGLAARLAEEPDDLEGWLRLGQARAVLGEPDVARDAYARALTLLSEDDPRRAEVEAAMAGLGG